MILDSPPEPTEIVVTAALSGEAEDQTPSSVTLLRTARIEALSPPLVADLLRLAPSTAVSTSGPAGSLTDVRIRGAEANHTLLFIDGIRANDPAAGNIPRFELLNTDLAARIEVVRGPQSALWGSEAVGGVIAFNGDDRPASRGLIELGSHRQARAAAAGGLTLGALSFALGAAWQKALGIDALAGATDGDRDGYANRALRGTAAMTFGDWGKLSLSGFALAGRSDFDGYAPPTYDRADTLDFTRNRLSAGRLGFDASMGRVRLNASASRLTSSNRNLLDADLLNRTAAKRDVFQLQGETDWRSGAIDHRLALALEDERETFRQRDTLYSDANQEQDRNRRSLTAEWRASHGKHWTADVALRHDAFSRFANATTLRLGVQAKLAGPWSLAASFGQGIAQPTFFDLFGYYPAYFTGNPNLKPERSQGFEGSVRYRKGTVRAAITAYRHRLKDEIATVFFPETTAVNSDGTSRRRGIELEGDWTLSQALAVSANVAYLDADEPADGVRTRESRRPRLSGAFALNGQHGPWRYGASMSHSGAQYDRRDSFPYDRVRLDSYWLANLRVGFAVDRRLELFGRVANALDDEHQDIVGYRTEGRTAHVGIRIAVGD